MSRIAGITPDQATGHTAEVYSAIKKSIGSVPNLFQAVGVNSHVLQTYLGLGPSLKLLSGAEQETVALVTSQINSCEYCLAAHTVIGGMYGLNKEETLDIRKGRSSDAKRNALAAFVTEVVAERGRVSDKAFSNLKQVGYTDAHIPEILLVVAATTFTNVFNNVNHTAVDFPAVEKI